MAVYWTDGTFSVVPVKDWMYVRTLGPIGRSLTFTDPQECVANGTYDATLTKIPGPKSQQAAYVKVLAADFKGPTIRTGDLLGDPPKTKGKYIKPYPHPCPACGGWMLQLFSSTEHEGGVCPASLPGFKRGKITIS